MKVWSRLRTSDSTALSGLAIFSGAFLLGVAMVGDEIYVFIVPQSVKVEEKDGQTHYSQVRGYSRDEEGSDLPTLEPGQQWLKLMSVDESDLDAETVNAVNVHGFVAQRVSWTHQPIYRFSDASKFSTKMKEGKKVYSMPVAFTRDPQGKDLPAGYQWALDGEMEGTEQYVGFSGADVMKFMKTQDVYVTTAEMTSGGTTTEVYREGDRPRLQRHASIEIGSPEQEPPKDEQKSAVQSVLDEIYKKKPPG